MKYKHGQDITKCKINDTVITDAKISIDKDGAHFICHNLPLLAGRNAFDKMGYDYSWNFDHKTPSESGVNYLKLKEYPPIPRQHYYQGEDLNIDMLEDGDVVMFRNGKLREVKEGKLMHGAVVANGKFRSTYKNDLSHVCDQKYDIIKIFKANTAIIRPDEKITLNGDYTIAELEKIIADKK